MRTKDLLILIKNLSKADKKSFTTLAEKQDGVQYLFLYRELEKISKTWSPEDGPVPVSDATLALKQAEALGQAQEVQALKEQFSLLSSMRMQYESHL
jgi:hypothetical protein